MRMGLITGRSFNECYFVVSATKGLQAKYDTKSRRRAIPTIVGMGGTDVQTFGRAKPPGRSGGVIGAGRPDWRQPGRAGTLATPPHRGGQGASGEKCSE